MKNIFSKSSDHFQVTLEEVRNFWQENPLCVAGNPYTPGSKEFFIFYDEQRESIESNSYSYSLHEYRNFAGKKVLDVGSGNGYDLSKYAAEGAEVFGIDITEAGIDLCRKRFELLGLKGDFRVADAQDLPFADNTFDCVCSMGVLHHIPDTQKALDEIFRVLKPGGRLIVMFYHRHSAKYQLKYRVWSWVTGKSMRQLVNEFDGVGNPKGVVSTKSELRAMLHKFVDINMQVGFLETRDIILRGARFLPTRLFQPLAPFIGWNLYAKARKTL
jgi:ubiquinone/menaquinone biosynthesis C-methylase UbiE